jgi:GT2 family glycosyltransferase
VSDEARDGREELDVSVAIVVLTHNRSPLLRRCVENVLLRTSELTREIVIWNNGSTDDTGAYLASLTDARIRVVDSPSNIGQNAYACAFALTSSEYLIELDDDVVDAPPGWDETLLRAFRRLPKIGFLAADLEDDPHDLAAEHRYRVRAHEYVPVEVNGVQLLEGPAGGGCAITSRGVYERVGGFRQNEKHVFWQEETAYIEDIQRLGYEAAVLAGLKVLHTGGPYYSVLPAEKEEFWIRWERARARRAAVKRLLLRVPLVRPLNARHAWFSEPDSG